VRAAHPDPRAVPGDGLLHPVALGGLLLLLLNDHVLKAAWPGIVTGKLSDCAGLVLAPLVVQASWEVGRWTLGRSWGPSRRVAVVAAAIVGIGFAAAKTVSLAADFYRAGLGILQWPIAALASVAASGTLPDLRPVAFVRDPTDLVALPALLLPIAIGWRRGRAGAGDRRWHERETGRPDQDDDRDEDREHAERRVEGEKAALRLEQDEDRPGRHDQRDGRVS
jgi:hypothetical protein